jgi:hypothetical protein
MGMFAKKAPPMAGLFLQSVIVIHMRRALFR